MNIEIEQKTTQLKNLMKVEQDEIEKMTFEKLLKFANETVFLEMIFCKYCRIMKKLQRMK